MKNKKDEYLIHKAIQDTAIGKVPPQAIDLEEVLLGALLVDNSIELHVQTFEILKPIDFYKESHRIIFECMFDMFLKNMPIDILTLAQELKKKGILDAVGGAYYVSSLTERVGSSANAETHARIIKQKSISRKQIVFGSRLVSMAYDEMNDCFEVNDFMLVESNAIINDIDVNKEKTIEEVVIDVYQNIEKASLTENGITGIPSGFVDLDRCYGGYQNANMYIKAARPGMGKTALILCEAIYQAYTLKKKVAIFSLEMPTQQLVQRVLSIMTDIPLWRIKKGKLNEDHWLKIQQALSTIESGTLKFFDNKMSLSEIYSTCKKMSMTNEIEICYIDYLQLIQSKSNNNTNREQEISNISRTLKQMAKEFYIPIIALSQLSRAVESRGGSKKPQLSDLRDSGAIEQDADAVEFIYRPEYYGIETDAEGNSTKGLGYILIAKNRHGALEDVALQFIGELTKFDNINPIEDYQKLESNKSFDNEPF